MVGFRGEAVGRSWVHVQPEAGSRVELLTVHENSSRPLTICTMADRDA